MTYLIAQYAILFALAALFGFLLGRWWVRRSFVDVTESYETISRAAANAPWDRVMAGFDGIDQTMRGSVEELRGIVQEEISALPKPEIPEVDLGGIHAQLGFLEQKLADIPQPQTVDLDPVKNSIADVSARIAALPTPDTPEPVNLDPLNQRVDSLESLIRGLPKFEAPEPVDFNPLDQRIASVEQAIRAIRIPEPEKTVDLQPLSRRIDALEIALREIEIPVAPRMEPVHERLEIIQGQLSELGKQSIVSGVSSKAESSRTRRIGGPRLLKSAEFGEKDDLKKISGVGPKLEAMLNRNGIFYFWQVADWSGADVKAIDDRLKIFKGRIQRDNWVTQARSLAAASTSAEKPTAQYPHSGEATLGAS